ncbi:unnamed protein product, partial [Candidula unifasciata]
MLHIDSWEGGRISLLNDETISASLLRQVCSLSSSSSSPPGTTSLYHGSTLVMIKLDSAASSTTQFIFSGKFHWHFQETSLSTPTHTYTRTLRHTDRSVVHNMDMTSPKPISFARSDPFLVALLLTTLSFLP